MEGGSSVRGKSTVGLLSVTHTCLHTFTLYNGHLAVLLHVYWYTHLY